MKQLDTSRLLLKPMSRADFAVFVDTMLTDPTVVEHYHFYRAQSDIELIRAQAEQDFWEHFEESREETGFEIWALFERSSNTSPESMLGWAGLLQSSLSEKYGGPELQYMIAGRGHGLGYATEASVAVMLDVEERSLTSKVIATVDIPNVGSIRVLEKLNFEFQGEIEAYGSSDMYLYTKEIGN